MAVAAANRPAVRVVRCFFNMAISFAATRNKRGTKDQRSGLLDYSLLFLQADACLFLSHASVSD